MRSPTRGKPHGLKIDRARDQILALKCGIGPDDARQAMSWPALLASQSPQFRGYARQWQSMFGSELPELLRTIGAAGPSAARWTVAVVRARAFAGDDPRARALLDGFEGELATVLGTASVAWPRRLRAIAPDSRGLELSALDPSQQLLLQISGVTGSTREHSAIMCLLAAAFGPRDEPPRAAELRSRLCTLALTPVARERWRAGFGLMPPDAVAPGEHHGAMRLLRHAFDDDGTVQPVDPTMCDPMLPEAALDVLLSGLAARAGLRRVGVMDGLEVAVVERAA